GASLGAPASSGWPEATPSAGSSGRLELLRWSLFLSTTPTSITTDELPSAASHCLLQ
ncbi:unnamed protein product, partial [Musa acuminata subsp. burmannicoides]